MIKRLCRIQVRGQELVPDEMSVVAGHVLISTEPESAAGLLMNGVCRRYRKAW
jgi:hypothetical protein